MNKAAAVLKSFQQALVKHGDAKTAKGMTSYFKNVCQFHGIRSPVLKASVFTPIFNSDIKGKLTLKEQVDLACDLLASKYQEEKSLAIHLLNKNVKSIIKEQEEDEIITRLADEIDKNVYDWGTCDTISSKVVCELIKLKPKKLAPIVAEWKDAPALWRQRSACVSFVKIARLGKHNDRIISICSQVVQNKERFAQLGCGWVLRELSLADLDLVVKFIQTNYSYFSREGLRYAIEKMEPDLKRELLDYKMSKAKKRVIVKEKIEEDEVSDEEVKDTKRITRRRKRRRLSEEASEDDE